MNILIDPNLLHYIQIMKFQNILCNTYDICAYTQECFYSMYSSEPVYDSLLLLYYTPI